MVYASLESVSDGLTRLKSGKPVYQRFRPFSFGLINENVSRPLKIFVPLMGVLALNKNIYLNMNGRMGAKNFMNRTLALLYQQDNDFIIGALELQL